MESHDAEFSEHGRTPRVAALSDTEKFGHDQLRALAELMHSMRIESIRQDFIDQPNEKHGAIHVGYITRDGDRRECIVWRKDQGSL